MRKYLLSIGLVGAAFLIHLCGTAQNSSALIANEAKPTLQYNQCRFTEGPTADKKGNVYFTDQPNNRILKWSTDGTTTVYMENCGRANGLYFDKEGNLWACADEKNQLWKIDKDKKVTVVISDFEGKKLNGPNDLWIDDKGGVYFTDPYYRRNYWTNPSKEIKKECLYYLKPNGKTAVVADSLLVKPNGIIGTPDGKQLYVSDIDAMKTYRYNINADGSLTDKTLFIEYGSDGMTIDEQGNVYITGNGVTVFDSKGNKIEHIDIKEQWTANVTFGGKEGKTLFITASKSVYTLEMNVKGAK